MSDENQKGLGAPAEVQIVQLTVAIPAGTTHSEISVDKMTGRLVGAYHYKQGELMQKWQEMANALGINIQMQPIPTTSLPPADPPVAP